MIKNYSDLLFDKGAGNFTNRGKVTSKTLNRQKLVICTSMVTVLQLCTGKLLLSSKGGFINVQLTIGV